MIIPCSGGMGLLTVVIVSGGVVLLVLGSHKLLEPKSGSSIERSCLISSGTRCDRKRKRVRFAPDVVEPKGNNEKYRRGSHTPVPNMSRPPAATPDFETFHSGVKQSFSLLTANKSTMKYHPEHVGGPVQERRIQTMIKPNIPANRQVLYNGLLQCSRMQRASVYWYVNCYSHCTYNFHGGRPVNCYSHCTYIFHGGRPVNWVSLLINKNWCFSMLEGSSVQCLGQFHLWQWLVFRISSITSKFLMLLARTEFEWDDPIHSLITPINMQKLKYFSDELSKNLPIPFSLVGDVCFVFINIIGFSTIWSVQ